MKEEHKATRTTQKKTVLIDRASEALEKLTNAYRGVNVAALEHAKEIQRPSLHQLEALRLFVLFINAFRQAEDKWPAEYLNNWPNLIHFITRSPSSKDLCLELQKLKKTVTRPHLGSISEETYKELEAIRANFLGGSDAKQVMRHYSSDKEMKMLATLALTSINHLIPDLDQSIVESNF